jgi:hypothetical protein
MSERLSPIETVMWRAGQDPTLRMTIGTLVVLDRSPSRDALVARLEAAVSEVPRLAAHPERLAAGPGRPTWTRDDDTTSTVELPGADAIRRRQPTVHALEAKTA